MTLRALGVVTPRSIAFGIDIKAVEKVYWGYYFSHTVGLSYCGGDKGAKSFAKNVETCQHFINKAPGMRFLYHKQGFATN